MFQTTEQKIKTLAAELEQLKVTRQERAEEYRAVASAAAAKRGECMRLRNAGLPTAKTEQELDYLSTQARNKGAAVDDVQADIEQLAKRLEKAKRELWQAST